MLHAKHPHLGANASEAEIVVSDEGFTVLHDPAKPECDIVFVHGLQGHPKKTWTFSHPPSSVKRWGLFSRPKSKVTSDAPQSVFWPCDLLREDLINADIPARISTYGYGSRVTEFFSGKPSQNNILEIGRNFLMDLAAHRRPTLGKPLMIISHSLGGIIVKDALRRASVATEDESDLRDVLDSTFALIFFGTPHRGGTYTGLGLIVANILKASGFSVNDRNIRDLESQSPVLLILREDFNRLLDTNRIFVSTFQESKGFTRLGFADQKIVPNESSELGHRNERIYAIEGDHMGMCRFSSTKDQGYRRALNEITRYWDNMLARPERARKECLRSLKIPEMDLRVAQIDSAHGSTLRWLYENPSAGLADWLRNGRGLFWIQGKPGSGKSTAMKFLFHNSRTAELLGAGSHQQRWSLIGCFFTDRGGEIQRSWNGILHSMTHQLLSKCPSLLMTILPFACNDTCKGMTRQEILIAFEKSTPIWSDQNLEATLLACKNQKETKINVCFLLDALDEHEGDHQRMGAFLHELANSAVGSANVKIKICIASRPLNDLRDLFENCPGLRVQDWTREDIENYVDERLGHYHRLQAIIKRPEGASRIEALRQSIVTRAEGVFLWVRLVVDRLIKGLSDGLALEDLEEEVEKTPDGLDDFFLLILKKIGQQYREQTYIILECLMTSRRALTVPQLVLILHAEANRMVWDESSIQRTATRTLEQLEDLPGLNRRIQSCCGGLVEFKGGIGSQPSDTEHLEPGNSIVQFLHLTVKEFIQKSDISALVFSDRIARPVGEPRKNGHVFILQSYRYWLHLSENVQRKFPPLNSPFVAEEVIHHAPIAQKTVKQSLMELFDDIDTKLADQHGSTWPAANGILFRKRSQLQRWVISKEKLWPTFCTFVAFAIAENLHLYLSDKLQQNRNFLDESLGGVSLAFLICDMNPKAERVRLEVAEQLLQYIGDVRISFKSESIFSGDYNALGVMMSNHAQCDWSKDGGTHLRLFNAFLDAGMDPNTNYVAKSDSAYGSEQHIATGVARLKLSPSEKFLLLRRLCEMGVDLNQRYDYEGSVAEYLMGTRLTAEEWHWLLEHRVKITRKMVGLEGLYSDKFLGHPLHQGICSKPEYYEVDARKIAWEHNPDWKIPEVQGQSFLGALISAFGRSTTPQPEKQANA